MYIHKIVSHTIKYESQSLLVGEGVAYIRSLGIYGLINFIIFAFHSNYSSILYIISKIKRDIGLLKLRFFHTPFDSTPQLADPVGVLRIRDILVWKN